MLRAASPALVVETADANSPPDCGGERRPYADQQRRSRQKPRDTRVTVNHDGLWSTVFRVRGFRAAAYAVNGQSDGHRLGEAPRRQ